MNFRGSEIRSNVDPLPFEEIKGGAVADFISLLLKGDEAVSAKLNRDRRRFAADETIGMQPSVDRDRLAD